MVVVPIVLVRAGLLSWNCCWLNGSLKDSLGVLVGSNDLYNLT
ncbi:hypothetical protein HMPREF1394_01109 [Helicobacter pylori GAM105Ai]|nr:hypothetical protein HMPREF1394_01109 [Helicobacter pylori GAM105Ai]